MKKLIIPVLLILLLCGCAEKIQEIPVKVDAEEILSGVVEKIDFEELQDYAQKGADALMEKYPALKPLADQEKLQELLKDNGLKLLRKYIESTDEQVQENAQKLGAIIKILSPQLTEEVDAVFAE